MESLIFPLLIALLAVPLFLQARKQKRTMQEQQKLQNSLTVGDRVMTTSGLFGTIVDTTDDHIELELAPGVTTTWVRQAVREKVITDAEAESEVVDAETVDTEAPDTEAADTDDRVEEFSSTVTSSDAGASVESKAEPVEQQKTG